MSELHSTISLGKYGSFLSECLINRPFYSQYEIVESGSKTSLRYNTGRPSLDSPLGTESSPRLLTSGIHRESADAPQTIQASQASDAYSNPVPGELASPVELRRCDDKSDTGSRANQKQAGSSSSRLPEIKKALKKSLKSRIHFIVLPVDVRNLTKVVLSESIIPKNIDIREEALSLFASWADVCRSYVSDGMLASVNSSSQSSRRYLVVDDTGGLVVASIAESLGILHKNVCMRRNFMDRIDDF